MRYTNYRAAVFAVVIESTQIYIELLKLMVPALIVVRILQVWGAIDLLGSLMSPLMLLIGLPAVLGVVWATTLLTNLFTGIVVFFEVSHGLSLSVEQVTVLGVLMLIGHSLPIEGAVARRAGVPWSITIITRVFGALLLAGVVHGVFSTLDLYQQPARMVWQAGADQLGLLDWAIQQVKSLAIIFVVILSLVLVLKIIRRMGIERLIHIGLEPVLKLVGIGKSATNVTVVGVVLGLSYGAGLLIRDLDKGVMNRRDSYLALCFLGLFHSIIEDTIVISALGAHISGILVARFIFAIIVIAILARFSSACSMQPKK